MKNLSRFGNASQARPRIWGLIDRVLAIAYAASDAVRPVLLWFARGLVRLVSGGVK